MEWRTWHEFVPTLMEDSDEWEKLYNTFYNDDMLTNPVALNVKKGKIFLSFARVDALIKNYSKIVSIIENNITDPNFDKVLSIYESFINNGRISNYKTQLKYGNNIIELFPVNPFALSIPSKKFVWIDLFKNVQTIPRNVNVQWDTELFSEFQIKISADSNFNIELEPLPRHRLLRIEGCIMYLFQKEENQNEVMNIRITIIPNTYDEKLTGDIHINYSQKDYKYNMNTSIEYLKKIKNTLLELNTLKDIVMEDKSINDTEIIEYKKKFGDKLESL